MKIISINHIFLLLITLLPVLYECKEVDDPLIKKRKLNFILIFAKSDICKNSNDPTLLEDLTFSFEKIIAPCIPKTSGNPLKKTKNCNCEYLLKTSLLSLMSWAQNIIGLSTATIHLEKCALNNTDRKRNLLKSTRRIERSPKFRLNIVRPSEESLLTDDLKAHKMGYKYELEETTKHKMSTVFDEEVSVDEEENYHKVRERLGVSPKKPQSEDEDLKEKTRTTHDASKDFYPKHKVEDLNKICQVHEVNEDQSFLKINQDESNEGKKFNNYLHNKDEKVKNRKTKKKISKNKFDSGGDYDYEEKFGGDTNQKSSTKPYKKSKHNRNNFVMDINNTYGEFEETTSLDELETIDDSGEKCKMEKITEAPEDAEVQQAQSENNKSEVVTQDTFVAKNDDKVEDVFQVFNIVSSIKNSFMKAFLDPLWGEIGEKHSPSLIHLVKQMLDELEAMKKSRGYIAVINAGKLSELKKDYSELSKTVRYLSNKCESDDTFLILTGDCPNENASRLLPLYVNGGSSGMCNKFEKVQELADIPQMIKSIIEHKYALL